jgi:DNA polymerase elongation subunit (family B)
MYKVEELKTMLFIDIETASSQPDYNEWVDSLPSNSNMKSWWDEKCKAIRQERPDLDKLSNKDLYNTQSPLYPEWARLVCISMGQIKFNELDEPADFKVRTFIGDEKQMLEEFLEVLTTIFKKVPSIKIVGHYIKGFDIPFICRKAMMLGIKLPHQLHMQKLKPWDSCLIDTAEIWKFGGWTSAKLGVVCESLGIPSPKEQMEGGEVSANYWKGNLDQITQYCERDVKATGNVMLKLSNMTILPFES